MTSNIYSITENICAKYGLFPDESTSGAFTKWLSDNVYVAIVNEFINGSDLGVEIGIIDEFGNPLLENDACEDVNINDYNDEDEIADDIKFLLKWAKNKLKVLRNSKQDEIKQLLTSIDVNNIFDDSDK